MPITGCEESRKAFLQRAVPRRIILLCSRWERLEVNLCELWIIVTAEKGCRVWYAGANNALSTAERNSSSFMAGAHSALDVREEALVTTKLGGAPWTDEDSSGGCEEPCEVKGRLSEE